MIHEDEDARYLVARIKVELVKRFPDVGRDPELAGILNRLRSCTHRLYARNRSFAPARRAENDANLWSKEAP